MHMYMYIYCIYIHVQSRGPTGSVVLTEGLGMLNAVWQLHLLVANTYQFPSSSTVRYICLVSVHAINRITALVEMRDNLM